MAPYSSLPSTAYNAFSGGQFGMVIARKNKSWYTQVWDKPFAYFDGTTPISVYWKHGWDDGGDPLRWSTMHEVHNNMELEFGETFNVTLYSMGQTPKDIVATEQDLTSTTYRLRNTFRQSGRKHALSFESDITALFRWGGADTSQTDRGLR